MRLGLRKFAILVLLGIGLCQGSAAVAQPPAAEGQPMPARTTEPPSPQVVPAGPQPAGPPVEASQLDTFLLRDSKGNLVPVLGMKFEEFEQLLKVKKGLAPPPAPGFTLDSLSITGTASKGLADLQITLSVRVRDEGWVRVPLAMKTAVLRERPRYQGAGEHFVTFDQAAGGYLAWFQGAGDKPHVLTLHAACNLQTVGEETRLALALPRATESSLRITTPGPRIEAVLSGGEGIASVQAKGAEQSEITVLGPSGELQLGWRKSRAAAASGPALFDVGGEIAVKVESETRVSSDAKLRVRSLSAPLEVFQVRLPAGMELVPTNPTGYTISVVSGPGDAGAKPAPQVVEVRLDRPTTTTAEVRLLATTVAVAGPAANLMPARFEVINAVRQRGTIDFVVEGQWQLDWNDDPSVRRLDIAADASAAELAARYEYFRQPCGLVLRVAPRPSRVSVEPLHVVYVEPRQIRVQTTLRYRLRGSRAAGLTFHLGDTSLDRLSPDDLLDAPEPMATDGILRVPFRQGVALPAELELKLETHRTLPEGSEQLSLTLPRPQADSVAPATVIVVPADNVELSALTAQLQGLSPDNSPLPAGLEARQQPPLVYRDLGGGEPAHFAAALKVKTRTVVTNGEATVRTGQQIQVEQRLEYRISHEPKRSFEIVAPRGLTTTGGLQVWLGAEPLALHAVSEAVPFNSALERLQFSTPSDQIGLFQVAVRYTLPMPRWDGQKPLPLTIPLVLPLDEPNHQFAGQRIVFSVEGGQEVEPDLAGVDEFTRPTAVAGNGAAFTWSKATSSTRWIVQPLRSAQTTPVVCHKAWIQTWLAPDLRQERAVFRLTTSAEAVRVRLPSGVVLAKVQAAINAQTASATPREPSFLRIEVPVAARGRECVLEVWYSLPPPDRQGGLLADELRPAALEEATPPRRTYWQLVLPADDHLLATPAELAAEMVWKPDNWARGPVPLLDQRELEDWIASSRQDPLPAGVNAYLFGTMSRLPRLQLYVASRRLILVAASGAALVFGLLLVFVPQLRGTPVLLVGAAVIGLLALFYPETALLLGWAAVLGVVVSAATGFWRWLAWGRPEWTDSSSAALASLEAPPSTTLPARGERNQPITTATAPAAVAAGESRP